MRGHTCTVEKQWERKKEALAQLCDPSLVSSYCINVCLKNRTEELTQIQKYIFKIAEIKEALSNFLLNTIYKNYLRYIAK